MGPYYSDEWVTLYHGDCLEITEWLSADVLVTDPPYGIHNTSRKGMYQLKKQTVQVSFGGDESSALRDTALKFWGERPRVVFGSWRIPRPEPVDYRLIWNKMGMQPGPANAPFLTQDEEIYVTGRGFISSSPPLRSVLTTSETRHHHVMNVGHPTPKPLGLMEALIRRCPPGVISDPFVGSGSTLIAAKSLGRRSIGVELEERYCEIAARRLSQDVFDFAVQAEKVPV